MRERVRQQLAQRVARLLVEDSMPDMNAARRKACQQMGIPFRPDVPGDAEIVRAVEEFQRLFGGGESLLVLSRMRIIALEAMRFLAQFSPELVGPVWDGSAGPGSPIVLVLSPQAAEDVIRYLIASRIPFRERSEIGPDALPVLEFHVDEAPVQLILRDATIRRKRQERVRGGSLRAVAALVNSAPGLGS